jgi:hypothetical protein
MFRPSARAIRRRLTQLAQAPDAPTEREEGQREQCPSPHLVFHQGARDESPQANAAKDHPDGEGEPNPAAGPRGRVHHGLLRAINLLVRSPWARPSDPADEEGCRWSEPGIHSDVGVAQSRVDPTVHRRAARRARLFLIALALLTVLALAACYVVVTTRLDGRPRSPLLPVLIIAGLLALMAGSLSVSAWAVRRRGLDAVSPLWGVDRATRTRIARAMKHQEELTGQDRELAVGEAIRNRKLAPLAMTAMIVVTALVLAGIGLSLAGDVDPAQLGLDVVLLVLVCALAVHQLVFYRRAGAYLERFGSPVPGPGSDTPTAGR